MDLSQYDIVTSLILILIGLMALRFSFLLGKRKAKSRVAYPDQKVEPQVEADVDAVRSAEMRNQLAMIDELLDITSSDTMSDQERMEKVHGRLKFYRRRVTFFFS